MANIFTIPDDLLAAILCCYGYYGSSEARKKKLEKEGFNYKKIQTLVNKLYPIIKDIK